MCFWQLIFVYRLIYREKKPPFTRSLVCARAISSSSSLPVQTALLAMLCLFEVEGYLLQYLYLSHHPPCSPIPSSLFPSYSPYIRLPRSHTAGLLDVLDDISVLLREVCDILTDSLLLLCLSTVSHLLLCN